MEIPDKYINNIADINYHDKLLTKVNDDLYLSKEEIELLELNKIPYKDCKSIKEVIFNIENIIDEEEVVDDDLDYLCQVLAERDYYWYTNK